MKAPKTNRHSKQFAPKATCSMKATKATCNMKATSNMKSFKKIALLKQHAIWKHLK